MSKNITLSQACDGLLHYKAATGMSPNTLRNYRTSFAKLQTYLLDNPSFVAITRAQLVGFFAWLRNDYVSEPDGAAPRGRIKLSAKTILNVHTDLSALWTWGVNEGYVRTNIVRSIDPPKVKAKPVEPFSKDEVEALLKACDKSKTWKNRRVTRHHRPTADRDRAIILLLLDTGLRASELCSIKISDLNLNVNNIRVLGKGQKERIVYFGKRTAKALWKHITPRLEGKDPDALLFTVGPEDDPRPLTRSVLGRLLKRIAERAGVVHVYPHRFRHTFAITYLRNGGDLLTLQDLLGHSDIAMVRRYAHIATADCAKAHRKASPVDNWHL